MPLLANYEGKYLPPQKLWYMVDGVWKEVVNVYENAIQNELAIMDQERIKQDQVVASLQTKEALLLASLDGSDPSVPLETDPVKIDSILQELQVIDAQIEITKTEQVVLTKKLFEQKAQVEYIKLVSEGEAALEKIAKIVSNPAEWQVIRIAPQSTLDERLEVAIQHGLDTNDRIFNYGLVYYRLIQLNSTKDIDNLDYLKENFKRRMDEAAYLLGIDPTNYILTVDDIQNVYTEVNAFVNAGAKRIEDYLASIKDQQKYILDKIEDAKNAMNTLNTLVSTGVDVPVVDGKIVTVSTDPNLVVPLGDVLLASQNVTTFDQLVSTTTLEQIAAGTADIANYPGITQLNVDATSLNEKIASVSTFVAKNEEIQNSLTSGSTVFSLNVLTTKKAALAPTQSLFWNTPLGDTAVSTSAGKPAYTQTYTSSGTYKFKNNELITLSTTYTAIINAIMAGTCQGQFGVTFKAGQQPQIISVNKSGTFTFGTDSTVKPTVNQVAIINAKSAGTQVSQTEKSTLFNDKAQPHHSIAFVKNNASIVTPPDVILTVTQPVINGLFYANTEEAPAQVKVGAAVFEYAFDIHPIHTLDYVDPTGSFHFNSKEIPLTDWFKNNDNIISQVKESILEFTLNFNAKEIPLTDWFKNNDNIISQVKETVTPQLLTFNALQIPIEAMKYNDNIIEQSKTILQQSTFEFHCSQTNNYSNVKNGYGQETTYVAGTNPIALNGISVIKLVSASDLSAGGAQLINAANKAYPALLSTNNKSKTYISSRANYGDYNRIAFYSKTRNILSSQTGLVVFDFDAQPNYQDTVNALFDSVPRMITPKSVRTIDLETLTMDKLNMVLIDQPNVAVVISNKLKDTNKDYLIDTLNYCGDGVTEVTTLITTNTLTDDKFYNGDTTGTKVLSGSQLVNKEIASIPAPAIQLNAGITLS